VVQCGIHSVCNGGWQLVIGIRSLTRSCDTSFHRTTMQNGPGPVLTSQNLSVIVLKAISWQKKAHLKAIGIRYIISKMTRPTKNFMKILHF